MSWNKRIKDLRIDHDMGKKELANKLDISERTLTRYESGISEPTISVLIKLSLLFNVSIDYIAGIKDEEAILTPSIPFCLISLRDIPEAFHGKQFPSI